MSAKCLEMLMYNTGQEKKGEQVEKEEVGDVGEA